LSDQPNAIVTGASADLVDLSRDPAQFPIVIAFPKSTSISYPTAVATAKAAARYMEVMEGGKLSVHLAAFDKRKEQFALAQALARLIIGLRGVQIYVNGIHQANNNWRFIDVLECFLTSLSVDDWRAHCQIVVDNPFTATGQGPGGPYLLPCHYMYKWGTQGYGLSRAHPSPMHKQIEASAARVGCSWCPNFHPEDFQKLKV